MTGRLKTPRVPSSISIRTHHPFEQSLDAVQLSLYNGVKPNVPIGSDSERMGVQNLPVGRVDRPESSPSQVLSVVVAVSVTLDSDFIFHLPQTFLSQNNRSYGLAGFAECLSTSFLNRDCPFMPVTGMVDQFIHVLVGHCGLPGPPAHHDSLLSICCD